MTELKSGTKTPSVQEVKSSRSYKSLKMGSLNGDGFSSITTADVMNTVCVI